MCRVPAHASPPSQYIYTIPKLIVIHPKWLLYKQTSQIMNRLRNISNFLLVEFLPFSGGKPSALFGHFYHIIGTDSPTNICIWIDFLIRYIITSLAHKLDATALFSGAISHPSHASENDCLSINQLVSITSYSK